MTNDLGARKKNKRRCDFRYYRNSRYFFSLFVVIRLFVFLFVEVFLVLLL